MAHLVWAGVVLVLGGGAFWLLRPAAKEKREEHETAIDELCRQNNETRDELARLWTEHQDQGRELLELSKRVTGLDVRRLEVRRQQL
jgi:hypothetical protein